MGRRAKVERCLRDDRRLVERWVEGLKDGRAARARLRIVVEEGRPRRLDAAEDVVRIDRHVRIAGRILAATDHLCVFRGRIQTEHACKSGKDRRRDSIDSHTQGHTRQNSTQHGHKEEVDIGAQMEKDLKKGHVTTTHADPILPVLNLCPLEQCRDVG